MVASTENKSDLKKWDAAQNRAAPPSLQLYPEASREIGLYAHSCRVEPGGWEHPIEPAEGIQR